jgi:tripartite-type tricarboxylate transporter receptor subunit TctC
MKRSRQSVLHAIAMAGALLLTSLSARADNFPSRPITMIVPFAAGGPADVFARIIAERMQRALGAPVIIDDLPGAAGTIATSKVEREAPDGYTLLIGPGLSTHVINAAIYGLPYDVVTDFQPIALLTTIPNVIVANKDVPADDLQGLIAWLKANPDRALQGTSGVGSIGHLAGVLFQKETGTQYKFVPYRGLGPALQDLLADRVNLVIDLPLNSLPYVRAGSLKAYAVLSRSRMTLAPDIPTVDKAGVPGLYIEGWYSIYGPKGIPKDVVSRLNAAAMETLADPAVAKRLAGLGHAIVPSQQQTPEALAALQKADIDKWWPIIKAAGIKPE